MGGERPDIRKPTSKLMLTILAGVARGSVPSSSLIAGQAWKLRARRCCSSSPALSQTVSDREEAKPHSSPPRLESPLLPNCNRAAQAETAVSPWQFATQ
jgi:hypothetical protein